MWHPTVMGFEQAYAAAGKVKHGSYYAMQDMTSEICNNVTVPSEQSTATLVDTRDNNTYTVAKLKDGKCWMTQNLRYSTLASYVSSTTYGGYYYYNQAITACPLNWHLPKEDDFHALQSLYSTYELQESPANFVRGGCKGTCTCNYCQEGCSVCYGMYWGASSNYYRFYVTPESLQNATSSSSETMSVRCISS